MDHASRERIPNPDDYRLVKQPKTRRICFIDNQLHRIIFRDRHNDVLTAWSFPEEKDKKYPYIATKRFIRPAFTIGQVSIILDRHEARIRKAYSDGDVSPPHRAGNDFRARRYWSEDQVMEMQKYFASLHRGTPRKDGNITPMWRTRTKEEVEHMIGKKEMLYVKGEEGFIPVWRTADF